MNTVDYPSYAELENSMTTDIENAKSFEEIKFSEPYIQKLTMIYHKDFIQNEVSCYFNSGFSICKINQNHLF